MILRPITTIVAGLICGLGTGGLSGSARAGNDLSPPAPAPVAA